MKLHQNCTSYPRPAPKHWGSPWINTWPLIRGRTGIRLQGFHKPRATMSKPDRPQRTSRNLLRHHRDDEVSMAPVPGHHFTRKDRRRLSWESPVSPDSPRSTATR
ncbi:hypothetical protein JKG47_10255 [Acidithiobacillus sp. MC6.1]|nr:hypothetical protein [Acidithiobacillus sp. MC6.1]